jgi:AraC-like DNA-binding protein
VAISDIQYPFRVNIFMWPKRTLFFGPLNHLAMHSLGSLAINIGVYKPFYIRSEHGRFFPTRCVVIPAGCKHEMLGYGNVVASLVIDRDTSDFHFLNQKNGFQVTELTQINSEKWIQAFQQIYEDKPSKDVVSQQLDKLLINDKGAVSNIDSRLTSVIHGLGIDGEFDFNQTNIAESVGLSSSRFRHLFKSEFKVPYRQYVTWRKVLSGLSSFHKVDNLTHAAMDAGFFDSAHLNRCFKNTLGVKPSQIFKNIDRFEV